MRSVGSVVAAGVLAAGIVSGANRVQAADLPATIDAAAKQDFDRYLLFGGFDLWRNGGSVHGGMLWSPGGLAHEGFTLKLLVAGGNYGYTSAGTEVDGRYTLASVMAGYRIKRGRLEATAVIGPDFQRHELTPDDLGNRMRGSHAGVRFGVDLWYQTSDTFMATASVSLSSIGPNYWTRAAVGWYLFDRVWIGPELMALGGDRYDQFRVGAHVTALRTAAFEWTAGVGFARDSDDRNGFYARIGVLTRR
jgi:hypothetical protein